MNIQDGLCLTFVACFGLFCMICTFKIAMLLCDYMDNKRAMKIGEHARYEKLRNYAASRLKSSMWWSEYQQEWYDGFSETVLDILVGSPIDFPSGDKGYQMKMDRLYDMLTK